MNDLMLQATSDKEFMQWFIDSDLNMGELLSAYKGYLLGKECKS